MGDIRRHWSYELNRDFPGWKQTGGSYVTIRSNKIYYRISNDEYGTAFIGGGNMASNSCFTLDIQKSDPTLAILQKVYRRDNCFESEGNESRDIVRAAYKLAQQRGIKTIEFTDNSDTFCPQKVRLADLSFLSTGRTWYESILAQAQCISCDVCDEIEEYREKVKTNTWRQVGHELIDIDISGVDIDASGSAMIVLDAMKKSKNFCLFFAKNMGKLLTRSGIQSLFGTTWRCEVRPGFNSRSRTPRSRRSTHLTQKRR